MDCVYSVDLNSYGGSNPKNVICSLSNKNILALGINECICALPLEKPNELLPINEINNQCTHLCWNDDGTHLLSIHKDLFCHVYTLKNGILNNFEIIHSFQLTNCKVVAVKWLNKSPKFYFNWAKKDSLNYLEKYNQKTFNTIKNTGTFANNGFIVLDKSGKLNIRLTDLNTLKSNFDKFEFDLQSDNFDLADFIFDDNDNIVVACSKNDAFSSVNVFNIKLEITNDGLLNGNCQLKSTFHLKIDTPSIKTHLLFCHTDQRNSLCFGLKSEHSNNSYILQFWNYTSSSNSSNQFMNTSDPIFDFEQALSNENKQNDDYSNEYGIWTHAKTFNCHAGLIDLNVPKFPIKYEDLVNGNSMYKFYLIASYDDGTIGYIDRVTYNQILSQPLNTLIESNAMGSQNNNNLNNKQKYIIKRQRIEQYFTSIDQSLSGTIGIGVTNTHKIILFRQTHLKDINSLYFLNLFEYLMFSGNDYWDLLVCMKQKLADYLIASLEERYLRQPLYSIQRAFFMRYYSMLFSLYRQSTNGQIKSIDLLTKLELNRCLSIISYSIQSIPIDSTNFNFISNNNSLSDLIDEALKYKHESKISLIDIVQNILNRKNVKIIVNQQLKHLFQWVIDLSLYLISISTSNKQQQQQIYGYSLLNDVQFLNDIRKCLMYINILFLNANSLNSTQNSTNAQQQNLSFLYSSLPVLPIRSSSPNKDLISDLFNIYTKFFNKTNDKTNFDDLLQDQCLNIQSVTLIKPMDELLYQIKLPWLGINLVSKQCLKLNIEQQFNEEKINRKDYPLFDIIRFIYFSRSQFTKQCIRCANYSEINSNINNNSNTSSCEDNSSIKNNCIYLLDSSADKCICGGLWILASIS